MSGNIYYAPASFATENMQVDRPINPSGYVPQPLPISEGYYRPPKQGSFTSSVRNAWDKLTVKAERSWNESTDDRFRRYFGFPFTELLYGEFWGEVWSGGQLRSCSIYLSTNWLCMVAKVKDPNTFNKIPIKAQFLLSDIIRVQRAITLAPADPRAGPIIKPVDDPNIRPSSVIICTSDGKMHQFANFFNYEKFMATLEYLWHSASQRQQQAGGYRPTSYSPATAPSTAPSTTKT